MSLRTSVATSYVSDSSVESKPCQIHYGTKIVRARIDINVPLAEIVNQLVFSPQLHVQEPSALFCLRDKGDDTLITDDNLLERLEKSAIFKLVSSPLIEAAEMVERLATRDEKIVKLATYELKKFATERMFMREFILRGGLTELVAVIESSTGNTLAYALTSMQACMDVDDSWHDLDISFITRIVHILCTQSLVNILRPTASILGRLARTVRTADSAPKANGSGFEAVWPVIRNHSDFYPSLARHVSAADRSFVGEALSLVNILMEGAFQHQSLPFYLGVDRAAIIQCVLRLVESGVGEDIMVLVRAYQTQLVAMMHYFAMLPIQPDHGTSKALIARLERAAAEIHALDNNGGPPIDGLLGIFGTTTQSLPEDLGPIGFLNLKFALSTLELGKGELARNIADQARKPHDKKWPFLRVSNAVTWHICHIFGFIDNQPQSTDLQPFMLNCYRVHQLGVKLFHRLWSDSQATITEFDRIAGLVGTELSFAIRDEQTRTIYDFEREVANASYRVIRDRQMTEMIVEDDLLNKAPVRDLRATLYQESYDFVKSQRIACMQQGCWFKLEQSNFGIKKQAASSQWRCMRLASDKKTLCYIDTERIRPSIPALEDLPHRISLTELKTVKMQAPSRVPSPTMQRHPTSPLENGSEKYAFSLVYNNGGTLNLLAETAEAFAEWVDGTLMLLNDQIATSQTADLIQSLTDIGLKIRLLDLTGDKVAIPAEVPAVPPPSNHDYFFGDI